jgi:hypothetical protein
MDITCQSDHGHVTNFVLFSVKDFLSSNAGVFCYRFAVNGGDFVDRSYPHHQKPLGKPPEGENGWFQQLLVSI